jgi:Raf kinase inhibitor-like YbhB/YbcL family protein
MSFKLGTAFAHKDLIPLKYTSDGDNVSPPVKWSNAPEGTKSYALLVEDPDTWGDTLIHWIIYDIPGEARSIPEATPSDRKLSDGSIQGENSWGNLGYEGPHPADDDHRYYFKLYALDTKLELPPGASKNDLERAMGEHILARAWLIGLYGNQ